MAGMHHGALLGNFVPSILPISLPASHSIQTDVSTTRAGVAIWSVRRFSDTAQVVIGCGDSEAGQNYP